MSVADLDHDGHNDILIAARGSDEILLYTNSAIGFFTRRSLSQVKLAVIALLIDCVQRMSTVTSYSALRSTILFPGHCLSRQCRASLQWLTDHPLRLQSAGSCDPELRYY